MDTGRLPMLAMPRKQRLMIMSWKSVLTYVMAVLFVFSFSPQPLFAQAGTQNELQPDDPLATKQKMILDRYKRFEDRVFRLQEQLQELEPENAARLGRVLDQSGELELGDRLQLLVRLLDQSSDRLSAVDRQLDWVEDAERVLGILLERDSDNEARKEEIERLQAFKERLDKILEKQESLKDASAQATMDARMAQQLGQALQRIEAMLKAQEALKDSGAQGKQAQSQQESLEEEANDLAEDLSRLSEQKPQDAADSGEQQEAREASAEASSAMKEAAEKMEQAGEKMKGESPSSGEQQSGKQQSGKQQSGQQQSGGQQGEKPDKEQEEAMEALEKAKEALKDALEKLQSEEKKDQPQSLSEEQGNLSEEAEGLSQEMDQSQQEGGQSGSQSSGSKKEQTPGSQGLKNAQEHMDKAQQQLQEDETGEAENEQQRAIQELQQAQKELEEALQQLRKEEREEVLKDLEVRFRELLSKQKAVYEQTVALDAIGAEAFKRPEKLQLAEMAAEERGLAQDATTCLQILDEDGTTVVFPRIIEQIAEDMESVAVRLTDAKVAALTQQIEKEIIEALEQLIESVEEMQQQNEQSSSSASASSSQEENQLLPESAELKLLRSSQLRVNQRTLAIEEMRGKEEDKTLRTELETAATRQGMLVDVAIDMREKKEKP